MSDRARPRLTAPEAHCQIHHLTAPTAPEPLGQARSGQVEAHTRLTPFLTSPQARSNKGDLMTTTTLTHPIVIPGHVATLTATYLRRVAVPEGSPEADQLAALIHTYEHPTRLDTQQPSHNSVITQSKETTVG